MSNKLTDEQLDHLLRSLVEVTKISDEQIDEIADAPQLWWSIQRNISAEKEAVVAPWPPSFNWLRFFSFAAPVAALVLVTFLIFTFRPTRSTDTAELQQNDLPQPKIVSPDVQSEPAAPQVQPSTSYKSNAPIVSRKVATIRSRTNPTVPNPKPAIETVAKEEVRSDFIELTYAQRPESGQIVRVKVPQSMKVSLGIVSSVEKPTDLVDAEVLIGDDGMTHAIRFISGGGK